MSTLFVEPDELWVAVHLPPQPAQISLERLAVRAQCFTPRISLAPPDGLLLEVKGSLKLFGGAQSLCRAVAAEYDAVGVRTMVALAPTPLAALACVRANQPVIVTDNARLIGHLSSLPLGVLRWEGNIIDRLGKIGVRTIGQALRLPRAGFARRFGIAQLTSLDRLTGGRADLRRCFQARERFRRRCDFNYEIAHRAAILEALFPTLEELAAFLKSRQCGVMRLNCFFRHRHAPITCCTLRLSAPAVDARHFIELLQERLESLAFPEAVRGCELRSGPLLAHALVTDAIWRTGEHGGECAGMRTSAFLERLRARLGLAAVYGLRVVADHRPEKAWRAVASDALAAAGPLRHGSATHSRKHTPWPAFTRPLWLLDAPRELQERRGLPFRDGILHLVEGPERIETGWWDGQPVARDYYSAVDAGGTRLWIFRERQAPHRWHLHGIFG